ncbi:unnamed protein product [Prunus armeniaca]|uniref:Uncharacterized protein n=1 Tax=Prunus armeniaca TaxID=36596 RepID=A0A6J5UNF4_PRUAR|nr:unnamed protein product [Prunus armeniaca]
MWEEIVFILGNSIQQRNYPLSKRASPTAVHLLPIKDMNVQRTGEEKKKGGVLQKTVRRQKSGEKTKRLLGF